MAILASGHFGLKRRGPTRLFKTMTTLLDLSDNLAKFPIAYGYQPVKGWAIKHYETGLAQSIQRTKQNALGEGPWDGVEKLYADAFEIPSTDYAFHPGTSTDPPDSGPGIPAGVAGSEVELTNGVTLTGQTVAEGAWQYYYVTVPPGVLSLVIEAVGSGDAALYTQAGSKPTLTRYDCLDYSASPETCTHANPAAGTWWIGAFGYAGGASFTITATFDGGSVSFAASAFFPNEEPHPWTAWIAARTPAGLSADQSDSLFGIYRTLKTANYDGDGVQIDINGDPVGGGDPRDYYFFNPNPANCAIDQLLRWGQRLDSIVNFPAFVDWRDYNDELIPWDDAKYTPRSLSLTGTSGGSLTPGQIHYVRVSTFKSSDESSASQETVEISASSITLLSGQTAFQVDWLIRGDELSPVAPPGDITSFRVYVGTVSGVWLGYFTVSNPSARSLVVTTLSGITAGNPLDTCTTGLLRNIKRFECGLFFVPPYTLSSALDRICQISCADWQWSGLGTGTYRNDMVRFLSPASRTPVFTLDASQTAPGTFKTWAIDRRQRYNQIVGNFRDRDDEFLNAGTPVILNRGQLQSDDKQVKSFAIDFGTCYRSQVQRGVSFWARMLCDLDTAASLKGSPKTYFLLPADVVNVTNATPDWTDTQFLINKKQETIETNLGDPLTMRIYSPDAYSDTDQSPLPSQLRKPRFDPFSAPPVASGLVLSEVVGYAPDMSTMIGVGGSFDFADFGGPQLARIFMKGPAAGPSYTEPSDSEYRQVEMIAKGEINASGFQRRGLPTGKFWFNVVTESVGFGASAVSGHPTDSIILIQAPTAPISLSGSRVSTDLTATWNPGVPGAFLPETYVLRVRDAGSGALKRTATIQISDWVPCAWSYWFDVGGDVGLITVDPDGSIFTTVQPTGIVNYSSQAISGDVDIMLEVDDRPFQIVAVVGSPLGSAPPTGVFVETAAPFGQPQGIEAEVATGLIRRLPPASSVEIRIRNNHAEYWLRGQFWMRSRQSPLPSVLYVIAAISEATTGPQAILRVRVRPFTPRQFVYTGGMATTDFGSGSEPSTVRIDVTQISAAGIESPVTTVTA